MKTEATEQTTTEQKQIASGFGPQTTAEEIVSGINLRGKTAVITGGHSGIGLETTRALALAGAEVVVGARDLKKAERQLSGIDRVETIGLDLAEPDSVDHFTETFLGSHSNLDILINNAGIMRTPKLMKNSRGHELQFATNHLGHFQLTARLWPALKCAGNARVVSLSSIGHRYGGVNLKDPDYNNRPYDKALASGESKTANSLFVTVHSLPRRGENLWGREREDLHEESGSSEGAFTPLK